MSPKQVLEKWLNAFNQADVKTLSELIPENMFEDGSRAILEWKDLKGKRGCDLFQLYNAEINFSAQLPEYAFGSYT